MREPSAVVRRHVRARGRRENDEYEDDTPRDMERSHAVDQLLGAPEAAHDVSAAVAAALELGPDGGMLPPSQLKHDCAGSASGAPLAVM